MRRTTIPLIFLTLLSLGFAPPGPGGLSPDFGYLIVTGALPWDLPPRPDTDLDFSMGSIEAPAHSGGYQANIDAIDADLSDLNDQVDSYETLLDTIRTDINAPTTPGDFDPGLEPDGSPTTVYGMADDIGASIGTVLGYMRALKVLNLNSSGATFTILFVSLAWVFLVRVSKFIIAIASDVINWLWKVWEAIPFF